MRAVRAVRAVAVATAATAAAAVAAARARAGPAACPKPKWGGGQRRARQSQRRQLEFTVAEVKGGLWGMSLFARIVRARAPFSDTRLNKSQARAHCCARTQSQRRRTKMNARQACGHPHHPALPFLPVQYSTVPTWYSTVQTTVALAACMAACVGTALTRPTNTGDGTPRPQRVLPVTELRMLHKGGGADVVGWWEW